jgi:hypothetical protein
VSAILLVALDPAAGHGFSPNRILEGLIGGGAALVVSSLFFPPDPTLGVARAAQGVFGELGRTLERVAAGLSGRDAHVAETALTEARSIDAHVARMHDELATSRDMALLAPPRRGTRSELERYQGAMTQVDFAVRNTRMLARHALRLVRTGTVPPELPAAVDDLASAIWELAAALDDRPRAGAARALAVAGAARASALYQHDDALAYAELLGQIRSTAADLVRAADLLADEPPASHEQPTEELLIHAA